MPTANYILKILSDRVFFSLLLPAPASCPFQSRMIRMKRGIFPHSPADRSDSGVSLPASVLSGPTSSLLPNHCAEGTATPQLSPIFRTLYLAAIHFSCPTKKMWHTAPKKAKKGGDWGTDCLEQRFHSRISRCAPEGVPGISVG